MIAGYGHPAYAAALEEFGCPRALTRSGGWVLERQVPEFDYHDAMGCYPIFTCQDWAGLSEDIATLDDSLLALSLVLDPFACLDPDYLSGQFDRVAPFKQHLVADMSKCPDEFVSSHHRYYARKALRQTSVEIVDQPHLLLDEWIHLYGRLIEKHKLRGIKAFSESSFAKQLQVPGLMMFRCDHQGATVGIHLWYVQNNVAYSHLTAFSDDGYRLSAAYALHWSAIQHLRERVAWLDLGASAGIREGQPDGLRFFKEGWSTGQRAVYFCGRILNHTAYQEVLRVRGAEGSAYFPAYRQGEMS